MPAETHPLYRIVMFPITAIGYLSEFANSPAWRVVTAPYNAVRAILPIPGRIYDKVIGRVKESWLVVAIAYVVDRIADLSNWLRGIEPKNDEDEVLDKETVTSVEPNDDNSALSHRNTVKPLD